MNIIDNLDYKLRNPAKDIEEIKRVHAEIEKKINRERPDPKEFGRIVSEEKIKQDLAAVEMLEKKWGQGNDLETQETKLKADIAEYIIYKNLGTWIDQKALPIITSKPDDYLRGIDLLLESESDNEKSPDINHIGIGIDVALVSSKGSSQSIENKKNKIKNFIRLGKLTEARYVSGGSFEGSIENLSYIAIFVSNEHFEDLFSSVLKNGSNDKEQKHILKYIIAYQILKQLGTYYQVSNKKEHDVCAYEYGKANNFAYDAFGHLLQEMETDPSIWKKVSQDPGVQEIEQLCQEIENA
jgi:hypothetical protein